jgi:Fe2+ or Zn2+ uptake regulation protein/O6-methylguanine-DNA--protein-cysteine methyltransferase
MTVERDYGELLRARGLRVTPQRRAILGAFSHGPAEHLSADEIHARATAIVPELGRGTVYATLAELTELGILGALGSPEPVRYETNTTPHHHFRCRLCVRLFDVEIAQPATEGLRDRRFVVEHVAVTAEGICADCVDYDKGLRAGAKRARGRPSPELPANVAATTAETPLGTLTLGATPEGVVRVVFESHADVPALQDAISARRGARAAREHIVAARGAIAEYFAGRPVGECAIDWDSLPGARTLRAALAIPRGQDASYEALDPSTEALARGQILGANPVAILVPCHRVTRGHEVPGDYVGGIEKRDALRRFERDREMLVSE